MISILAAGSALLQIASAAEDKPAFSDQKEKVSYGIGMSIGSNLKRGGFDVDVDVLAGAIKDVMSGDTNRIKMTEQQARDALMAYQREMAAKRQEEQNKLAETNRKAGEEFLAANKKKEGIQIHTVTNADGSTAELQYKVLKEGDGPIPKATDTVNVIYRGTFINGTEFDSTAKHGEKASEFPVSHVIRGWTEALQMMKVGSKWQVFLPSALAYGDRGSPNGIEPGATLLFEMELVGIKPPPPPPAPAATAQPLTSDIIRVPSAEELKKGAKIEVIKAEDVEKMTKAAQTTNSAAK